jgi:hypothetical protein
VDLGNARKRKLHPTAAAIGIKVGGWHDFRHTLKRQMRRAGVDPVIVRDTLGHKKVEQQDVYDVARRSEVGNALRLVGRQLEPNVESNQSIQRSQPLKPAWIKEMVSAGGIEPPTY